MKFFNFAFWNCAVSPPRKKQDTDCERVKSSLGIASRIISEIISCRSIELIALCEVSEDSFFIILEEINRITGCSFEGIYQEDKSDKSSKFDIGCIFNGGKIKVSFIEHHRANIGKSSIKVGQSFDVIFLDDITCSSICFFISHWSSRIYDVGAENREESSKGLRDEIKKLIRSKKQFVLMGDYNDPPYSDNMVKNLKAINDRSTVIREPNYWLYNPYWKTLYSRNNFSIKNAKMAHDLGTCYSYNSTARRNFWNAFDQIIFSGSFVTEGPWFLEEEHTDVFLKNDIIDLILNDDNVFDHIPVLGCVAKKEVIYEYIR